MKKGGSHGKAWRANNLQWRALIADQENFTNIGKTLEGVHVDGLQDEDGFGLSGKDMSRFTRDAPLITYVVFSYDVPIHWATDGGATYTIERPPSKTTTGHRNLCPGYTPTREGGWTYPRNPDGPRRRVRKTT